MDGKDVNENELTFLLNQNPPAKFIREHPTIKVKNKEEQYVPLKFIPRENVEYMLTRIYGSWKLEIRNVVLIANSPVVTVRLYVNNPITKQEEWQDGIGASPIQTDAGKGAVDFMAMKSAGVMMAAPAAETYAFKDAAEKFGKIFGKDLNVREQLDYSPLVTKGANELPQTIIDDIERITELEFLQSYYDESKQYHRNHKFIELMTKQREKLKKNG